MRRLKIRRLEFEEDRRIERWRVALKGFLDRFYLESPPNTPLPTVSYLFTLPEVVGAISEPVSDESLAAAIDQVDRTFRDIIQRWRLEREANLISTLIHPASVHGRSLDLGNLHRFDPKFANTILDLATTVFACGCDDCTARSNQPRQGVRRPSFWYPRILLHYQNNYGDIRSLILDPLCFVLICIADLDSFSCVFTFLGSIGRLI